MPIPQTDPGPFLSALGWVEDVGQIPLQALRGRFGASGRKIIDVLGDIPDALIPGDWIPSVGDEDPNVRPSELIGLDPMESPGLARAADIVGGAVTNPLTYVGARGGTIKAGMPLTEGTAIPGVSSLVQRGRDVIGAGVDLLPEGVREAASNTAAKVRRTANWLQIPEEGQALTGQAQGLGSQAARVASERVKQIYEGLSPAELEAVGEIAHGIQRQGADRQAWRALDDADLYLQGRADVRPDVVRKAVAERQILMDELASQENVFGQGLERGDYIQRQFDGDYFRDLEAPEFIPRQGGMPQAVKGRTLESRDDLLRFLQETPDAELNFNALEVDARRAAQQGRLVEKAEVGKRLTGKDDFVLSDPTMRGEVDKAIAEIARENPDYAYKLNNLWRGVPPRENNWFAKALHTGNRAFKSAATFGILIPRIGFSVRNRLSNLAQVLSVDAARGTVGSNAKRVLSDLWGAIDDGFIKMTGGAKARWSGSDLTKSLDHIENSYKQAGGSVPRFRELLGQHPEGQYLQEALDNGVLDSFVSSEELLTSLAKSPRKQFWDEVLNWPAALAQGVEQRMRLGTFMDLRKGGIAKDGADAARTVRDVALDYSVPGKENRTFRDFVPFGAFLSQNVKQQGKFIARNPVALTVTAPLFSDDENLPKYPWQEGQLSYPIGIDEQGNAQYLGAGGILPLEGLTAIPGFGSADAYRDIVGSLQPALKTGFAYLADRDPLTGQDFGEYNKVFGHDMGEAGRVANIVKQTGLVQPITGPLDQSANLLDERKSPMERALQATTGLRFLSVDPDQAKRQRIEQYLEANPAVRQFSGYYQQEGQEDPGLSDLLQQLQEAKERLKAKRQQAASVL